MKAVGYKKSLPVTDPESLTDIEVTRPVATNRDILVRVEAVSVNPVDTKIRRNLEPEKGEYKILGWDAAGVVDSVGESVSMFKPGDAVWYAGAIDRSGTNAEYHLVDERIVSLMPASLEYAQAAALPLTSITAWEILFDRLRIEKQSSGTILVIGAGGGVGSILVQLAKQMTQLTVVATASRTETIDWLYSLGADYIINHKKSLVSELQAIGINTVDYVVSLTNTGDHAPAIAELISPQGRMAIIDDPDPFDIMSFKKKSISIHWEFMFTRSLFQTEDMIEQHRLLTEVANMVDRGKIRTTVKENCGKINAKNLVSAHSLLESGKSVGKIVMAGF